MKWESIGQVGVWQRIDADIILHQVSVSLFNTRLIFFIIGNFSDTNIGFICSFTNLTHYYFVLSVATLWEGVGLLESSNELRLYESMVYSKVVIDSDDLCIWLNHQFLSNIEFICMLFREILVNR